MTWAIPLELVSEFRSGWATESGTISFVSAWVFLLLPRQASENSFACAGGLILKMRRGMASVSGCFSRPKVYAVDGSAAGSEWQRIS